MSSSSETTTTVSNTVTNKMEKKSKSPVDANINLSNHKHDEWACTAKDCADALFEEGSGCAYNLRVVGSNHLIWIIPLILFCVLTVSFVAVVWMHFDRTQETRVEEALSVASETGKRFSDFLDNSITPLFSLAQFVHELDEFRDLPNQIGPLNGEGSLPMMPNSTSHRNITGVCDNPHLKERYEGIAGSIKKNSKQMQGVLVNLQLVPEGVVCLLHPVVNAEDFPPGKALNNTGAIGHDLIADPRRRFHAEESLKQGDLVIVGPIPLVQCQGCDPIVEQAFIARLPVFMDGHTIQTHEGQVLPRRWGFAVALINWQVLVEKTHLYDEFADRGWGFQLTRMDHTYNAQTQQYDTKTVVLAETKDFQAKANAPKQHQVVQTKLDTTDSEWTIKVVYNLQNAPAWKGVAIALILLITALISSLAFIVLFQKQVHSELVKANLVRAELSARAERDLNDFIAHEIRNPLSAAMSAGTFLATTVEEGELNYRKQQNQSTSTSNVNDDNDDDDEKQSLLLSHPYQSIQEDVSIINSSLHFINDLLRNLLDVHRAASRQLVLEEVECDLLTDVLEPVAAMLQHRDREFAIQIQLDPGTPQPFLVKVDRLRLQQVVLNLGRNSAKFVTDGPQSFVRLRARLTPNGSVDIMCEDSGSGIPPSKRHTLFNRFQESLDSMSQGTGVGLNLCKTLVELMGGELYLDETYNSGVEGYPGARFVVHLKACKALPSSAPPSVEFQLYGGTADHPPCHHLERMRIVDGSKRALFLLNANGIKQSATEEGHSLEQHTGAEEVDVEMGVSSDQTTRETAGVPMDDKSGYSTTRVRRALDHSQQDAHESLPAQLSILFVDDERILRKLAMRAFSRLAPEWTVEETASGEAALQLVVQKQYDMVFLDQYFTSVERRLTGTETARAMRAKGITSIICGVSANDLEGAFLKAGADVFTTKPFATNQEQLKKFMLRVLQEKR